MKTTIIVTGIAALVVLAFATGLVTRRPPFRPPQLKYQVGDICDDGIVYRYPTNLHDDPEWIVTNPALREKIEKRNAKYRNHHGWVAVGSESR